MSQFPQLNELNTSNPLVTVHTNHGDFKLELFPEIAPKTVENFVTHAKNGYYNGVIFHRVIEDFMIQGGDPTSTGMGGESIYGRTFNAFDFKNNVHSFNNASKYSMTMI